MKRFKFQLEPVLDYKMQVLDAQMVELGAIQARLRAQEAERDAAYQRLFEHNAEYIQRSSEGISVADALGYQMSLQVLEQRAKEEDARLERLRAEEEAKREEVIETRKDTHSLERLRDIRRSEYDQAAAKAEEKNLDDLTAAKRAAAVREEAAMAMRGRS